MKRFFPFLLVLLWLSALPVSAAPTTKAPLGTNLGGIASYNPQWSFTDAFKMARPWISQCTGCGWGQGGDLDLTPEGWVGSLQPNHWAETILLDGETRPEGEYVILYEGEGDIAFGLNSATVISETPGRIVITITPDIGLFLQIRSVNSANPVRNIRVIMPGFETTYQTTNRFHPVFLERLAPFDTLRFMDWMVTNNSEISTWDERPKPTDATYSLHGAPVEEMVLLANTLNVNPWFTLPHLATDDYMSQFAAYVRDNLEPELKAYIEYSNETWNGQFAQATYVMDQGEALGLSTNRYQAGLFFHSRRATEMFAIWEQAFGGTDRIVRVLAAQAANSWTGEQVMSYNDAYLKADALAIAPYFGGFLGDPDTASDVSTWTPEHVLDEARTHIRGDVRDWISSNLAQTQSRNIDLISYEGGQHLVGYYGAENNESLTNLFMNANRHPLIRELYAEYLDQWNDLGGGLFMHFTDVGPFSKWGSWGALEYQDQDIATAPKYQALLEYLYTAPSEQLANGGFEGQGALGKKSAASWVDKSLVKDKRVCNKTGKAAVAKTGNCAFRFDGTAGVSSSLKQNLTSVPGKAGDTMSLSAWVQASNLSTGGKIQAKIKLNDDNKVKITLDLTTGTYGYTAISNNASLPADASKTMVSIKMTNGSGKFWIDDVSLQLSSDNTFLPLPLP